MSIKQPLPISIVILAALTAMGPLSVDAYLPAMPAIADNLAISIHQVELSLSLYLAGFAIGQIIGGPFSDRFGRRYGVMLGTSLFFVGSVIVAFAQGLEALWIGRVIQAFGGGIAIVNSSAIIRDLSSGRESARLLSHMAIIMMIAPLLAPSIGVVFLHFTGWRSIFVFLGAYSLLIFAIFYKKLPETRRQSALDAVAPKLLERYTMVLRHRKALSYMVSQCLAYGGMFAFITASPVVYIKYFEVSEKLYPFLFGANILCMVTANRINVYLLRRLMPPTLLSVGQLLQLSAGVALLAYVGLSREPQLYGVMLLVMFFVGSHGFISSNSTACTVEFFPTNSGTATALIGAFSFLTGAVAAAMVSFLGDGTPWPMAVVMAGCAIISLPLRYLLANAGKKRNTLLPKA